MPSNQKPSKRRPKELVEPDSAPLLLANTRALIAGLAGIGGHGYFVWDYAAQRMIAGGDRLAELYGYTEAEVEALPGSWGSLVHPDDRRLASAMRRRLQRATASTIVTERLRIQRSDGRWDIVHISQRVLERDRKGRLVSAVGLSQVITSYVVPYEEIVKREVLYRQMVDDAGDGILQFDSRGAIYYANRCLERLLGFKKDELRGVTVWQIFELRREGKSLIDLRELVRSQSTRLTCQARRLGGGQVVMDLRVRCLDKDRYLGIARDMTHEMLHAESSRQQAAYYRGLFINNTSGVAVLDGKLRITAINRALSSLLKFSEKELVGSTLIDLIAQESLVEAQHTLSLMSNDRRFNAKHRSGVKFTLRSKDNRLIQVQTGLTAIGDADEICRQGIAIFTDITEEQRFRRERDDQAQFNEALLANTPAAILVSDPRGLILDVNPAVTKLTGFPRKHFIGKHGYESGLLDEEQIRSSRKRMAALLAGAAQVNSTLRIFTRKGGTRIVETQSTAARRPNGEVACIIITAMDVTEQKRLETEVIKVAEQEQMRIGNDLHDGVGQMLTGIMSLTEALETSLNGELKDEAVRIRELVRDTIQQVRQMSHGLSPAAVKHRGLASSLQLLGDSLRSKRLECVTHLDWEPTFKNAEAETHLFRVAQEAVSNAIRHGKPTSIAVSLRHEKGDTGLMEIEDNGVGISATKAGRSDGIGIRVMRYRIGLIGGDFKIARRPEGGTRVTCRFSCAL